MVVLLAGKNYKKFTTQYKEIILDKKNKPIKELVNLAEEYIESLEIEEKEKTLYIIIMIL